MSQGLRALLSEEVAPFLEWLGGLARSKEDGEAPALTAEDEQRAVSYTHLDVYKRQLPD